MRVDSATRRISASPEAIYRAFSTAEAIRQWLPPGNMVGKLIHFDFRENGSYRMRLTYKDPSIGTGKSSEDSDEFVVSLVHLDEGRCIEQEVTFESDDPRFSGVMRMIWTFRLDDKETLVTIQAENVPPGISPEDHEIGLNSSLANLAAFVEAKDG